MRNPGGSGKSPCGPGTKHTNGVSKRPNTCWPGLCGGPASIVTVKGVQISVINDGCLGGVCTNVNQIEGPRGLMQGTIAVTRPPNDNKPPVTGSNCARADGVAIKNITMSAATNIYT
jgi:hypothetical protein